MADDEIGSLFTALEDSDCRSILEATSDVARSASELSDQCDLPQSTTYRKIDKLTDAGLLEEGIRLSQSGKHTNEYVAAVEDVRLSLDGDEGVDVEISYRSNAVSPERTLAGAD